MKSQKAISMRKLIRAVFFLIRSSWFDKVEKSWCVIGSGAAIGARGSDGGGLAGICTALLHDGQCTVVPAFRSSALIFASQLGQAT